MSDTETISIKKKKSSIIQQTQATTVIFLSPYGLLLVSCIKSTGLLFSSIKYKLKSFDYAIVHMNKIYFVTFNTF